MYVIIMSSNFDAVMQSQLSCHAINL